MQTLIAGANTVLTQSTFQIDIHYQGQADITAYLLKQGKVRGDADMIFYGQTQTPNGSVRLATQSHSATLFFDTNKIDSDIEKIAICATMDNGNSISALKQLNLVVPNIAQANEELLQRQEAAVIVAEVYRHNGQWKIRFVMQGFNGGLQPLAEHFGVEIADEPSSPTTSNAQPTPTAPPSINLSKITLDKTRSSISLEKRSQGFGKIAVNLNWNQRLSEKQGFLARLTGGDKNIDLDLGAMIRFQNGDIDLVQALGNRFGNFEMHPYVKLSGDDRTGAVQEGEWLYINGAHWDEISQIVVYCFIYEGVPNWAATDGVVRVQVPNQPEIEVRLTEGRNNSSMCGIVELRNEQGNIQMNRIVEYFSDHRQLDNRFNYGFSWIKGRK
ncbi:TerD family protein [Suttonella ornithocola]|uniref:General stress protein 16U n=1 Tax=Suttonella ornithocola TaxID=279832 RepID=A0A380MR47_9GAMM|nr:TerD family protein [Suttonella ornithocola]SUO94383.1 General stress protein 16U [Suttonella ornithocola]